MHDAIKSMLTKYRCNSQQDYVNALKEIFQEIALLGLWRAKFFEKAAFYGGSALRILYGLDRFSEDLDFSLLKPDKNFNFHAYNRAIISELAAFGFQVTVQSKIKPLTSNIESAFIKAETKKQLLVIEAPDDIAKSMHHMQSLKIKMEIDTTPPGLFTTDTKFLLQPIAFSIKSFSLPDSFAGKLHALLCRPWISRIKGRDWYDFVWYLARNIPVHLAHLQERLVQSKAWPPQKTLNKNELLFLLTQKIQQTDFIKAQQDVIPFINNPSNIKIWSQDFFKAILVKIQAI